MITAAVLALAVVAEPAARTATDAAARTALVPELAGIAEVAETSTVAPRPRGLGVLILPTISGELVPREPVLDVPTLRAFSGALGDAAASVFAWRRFELFDGAVAQSALAAADGAAECRSEECARRVALGLGATHVLFSRLTKQKDGACAAVVTLIDLLRPERGRTMTADVKPCTADNVLVRATDLGRDVADGPRAPVRVTLDLTPRELPAIDVPEIPDLELHATTTSTRARRGGLALGRALEIYAAKHMFVFDDEERPTAFHVVRDRRILNECEVRRAASAPLTPRLLEQCEGNSWEWAWSAVPVGLLLAGVGAGRLDDGGTLTLVAGAGVAITAAIFAIAFDLDPIDETQGVHPSPRAELEAIVAKSNRDLREVLDLTEADVLVAGMRL
ncbi:hypothetical protein L6R52_00355 [Myxococcota bacterium]|nr:hypothetical protein [Myxococcota bacterium]